MDMPHSCALLLQQHAHFCSFEACDVLWTTKYKQPPFFFAV
jgi:hypothetical protein